MTQNNKYPFSDLKTQLLFLGLTVIGVLTSIKITIDQINFSSDSVLTVEEQESIRKRGLFTSGLFLFIAIYFLYVTYASYQKKKSKTNGIFLIAAFLVFIAALMRFIELSKIPQAATAQDLV